MTIKKVTDQQVIDAIKEHGSKRAAAQALGIARASLQARMRKLESHFDPSGREMKNPVFSRTTVHLNSKGEVVQEWPRYRSEVEDMKAILDGMKSELPKFTPTKFKNPKADKDIIPFFNIGDAHLGALASESEVLMDNDISITEREMMAAMVKLINDAPQTERCVINDLGDATHYQDNKAESESGHRLDYDTRYYKMMRAYVRIMRSLIEYALTKYRNVDLIINQGNHSRSNDIAMREFMAEFYRDEKRLNILPNANVHIPYRMGNAFIVTHHGDKTRGRKLADVMAHDYAHDFGEARYKYAWSGHVHHSGVRKDENGVISESFGTMSRGDKYAHDGGWRNRKCMTCVYMSKTYGERGRDSVPIEMVIDIVNKSKPGTYIQNSRAKVYTV